jgi:adenosine kinase
VKFAIEHSDFVFCNEDEASAYAKLHNLDPEDRIGAAKHIAGSKKVNQKRQRVSIVTVGCEPVIIAIGQPDNKEAEVHTVEVPKIAKDLLVDTNGAGDSFVGGFMAALSQGESVLDCVKAGIALSGHVVQRLGCTFE